MRPQAAPMRKYTRLMRVDRPTMRSDRPIMRLCGLPVRDESGVMRYEREVVKCEWEPARSENACDVSLGVVLLEFCLSCRRLRERAGVGDCGADDEFGVSVDAGIKKEVPLMDWCIFDVPNCLLYVGATHIVRRCKPQIRSICHDRFFCIWFTAVCKP